LEGPERTETRGEIEGQRKAQDAKGNGEERIDGQSGYGEAKVRMPARRPGGAVC
jgi:hypothetical protein